MKKRLAGCVLSVLLVFGGCGTTEDSDDTNQANEPSADHVRLPDTIAGRQLTWFLDQVATGTISDTAYRQKFAKDFRRQVPRPQLQQIIGNLDGIRVTAVKRNEKRQLAVLARVDDMRLKIAIAATADGSIHTLRLQPHHDRPKPPTTWSALDTRLAQVAPEVSFLAAKLTEDGRCLPIHGVRPDKTQPMGSMFKLYVLDTVARQVEEGRLSWNRKLTIEQAKKSLPSGKLQNRPDGDTVTVAEAARLMISISDNTATDLLIEAVGRRNVERTIERTSGNVSKNSPLLTTRELFILKSLDYPEYAETYLDLAPTERRNWLVETLGDRSLRTGGLWKKPRKTEVIEWFADPGDVCSVYANLTERNNVDEVLSVNDGGLGLDSKEWPQVWFKGGSEPGVLTLGYLAEATDGSRYVLTVMATDPEQELDPTATVELLSLVEGGFALVR